RQTATGVLLCDIKLDSTDLGDDDLISSLLLIVNPASTSFAPIAAATAEVTIPSDAYLLLGLAYMVRNKPGDNANAVTYMTKLGGTPFNSNFIFQSKIGMNISNPEAHALMAMAYFYTGDETSSRSQLSIARGLDPNGQYSAVAEVSSALTIIGF
ncbi:MAG: hypothetical protein PHQ23_05965, partial [Candidatus Wallbacteria bacterium]|nr:hypothetical protein [Candidatus Wallbacteria bacterium]